MPNDSPSEENLPLAERLAQMMEGLTLEKVADEGIRNAELNGLHIRAGKPILELRNSDLAEGDTALVLGAGPSLHRQNTARMIKESNFDGIIIVTESALSWCLRNDIVPDLAVTVDPHATRIVRWFGDPDLTEESIRQDDYYSRQDMDPAFRANELAFNRNLLELMNRHGKEIKIAVASSASTAVVKRVLETGMDIYWWNPLYDDYDLENSISRRIIKMNGLPCLNAGGNVGTASWVIAHAILGKSRVGLLGIDLSYYADTTYRETQYYNELLEILGADRLAEAFTHIHNPYVQRDFFTDPAYLWYRNVFLQMADQAKEDGVVTYNCSGGGILFGNGIEFVPFADFADRRI